MEHAKSCVRLYDYGARYYDPRISMFYGVDPLAEKYPNISPFAYCFNNPLRFIDPTGMEGEEPEKSNNTGEPTQIPEAVVTAPRNNSPEPIVGEIKNSGNSQIKSISSGGLPKNSQSSGDMDEFLRRMPKDVWTIDDMEKAAAILKDVMPTGNVLGRLSDRLGKAYDAAKLGDAYRKSKSTNDWSTFWSESLNTIFPLLDKGSTAVDILEFIYNSPPVQNGFNILIEGTGIYFDEMYDQYDRMYNPNYYGQ